MKDQRPAGKFIRTEIWLHNIMAVLFIALLVTGVGMLCCNFDGNREDFRCICKQTHQLLSLLLLTLPPLLAAGFAGHLRRDLMLMYKRKKTSGDYHARGKTRFNRGQKLWANVVLIGSLTLGISGAIMWSVHSPILALVIHIIVTMFLLVLLFGHLIMVAISRRTVFFERDKKISSSTCVDM